MKIMDMVENGIVELDDVLKQELAIIVDVIDNSRIPVRRKYSQKPSVGKSKFMNFDQEAMKSVRITHSSDDDNSESDSLKSSTIISEIPKKKATTTRANTIAHDFGSLAKTRLKEEDKYDTEEAKTKKSVPLSIGKNSTKTRRATIMVQPNSKLFSAPLLLGLKNDSGALKKITEEKQPVKANFNHMRRFSRGDSLPGFTKITSKAPSHNGDVAHESTHSKQLSTQSKAEEEKKMNSKESPTKSKASKKTSFPKRQSRVLSDRSDLHLVGSIQSNRRKTVAEHFMNRLGQDKNNDIRSSNPFG